MESATAWHVARSITNQHIGCCQLSVKQLINNGSDLSKEFKKNQTCCKHDFIFSLSWVFFCCCCFSTLMCILALFSKLSVVCLVLSGPKGTSFFNCSRYSRSLARLQTHKHRVSQQTSTSRKVRWHLRKQTDEGWSTRPWRAETHTVSPTLWLSFYFIVLENMH